MLTLFSALVLVGAAVSLAVLGRRTGHLPPTETRYAMPARPLPETENNFQRLLAENMMLKEELRKAEAMNQDLQSLILRESIDSVAEEAKPATEAPDSKAALPSALPTESTGHSPLPDHGSATTRLACPAPTLPVT